ncbi:MAG: SBBP repeat-containing protein [Promethearchaeota archaeon]
MNTSSNTFSLEKLRNSAFVEDHSTDLINSVFRENDGQVPNYLSYYSVIPQGMVGFGCSKVYFFVGDSSFGLTFIDANSVEPTGIEELQGFSNYFIGEQVFNKVNHFSQVVYKNLYDGISLRYRINSKGMKYEFLVDPYTDIKQIKMVYLGVDEVQVDPAKVEVIISNYSFIDEKLDVWYADNGQKIDSSFIYSYCSIGSPLQSLTSSHFPSPSTVIQFSFAPSYDYSRPIIIDPLILTYSTYIGGSLDDIANDIALDSFNNIYITGWTKSLDFPSQNVSSPTHIGNRDVFVTKLSSNGSFLYTTFIGGIDFDTGNSIVLNGDNIYITGATRSADFPMLYSYDSSHGGFSDAFLLKLSTNGSLLYSTFIGGSAFDSGDSLALDSSNNTYIIGNTNSLDFPVVNAYDPTRNGGSDAFIVKLSANGSSLLYSTYIGGSRDETLEFMVKHMDIALDHADNIYITGTTWSRDFPTVNAYDSSLNGGWDTFFVKFASNGSLLLWSTFIGGRLDDFSNEIVLDGSNGIYITGSTNSNDFPTLNAYDSSLTGEWDIFLVKLSTNGSLQYSTFIGGNNDDYGYDIVLDNLNNILLTGETSSEDYFVVNAYDSTFNGESDAFLIKISVNGSSILYSTYFGGTELDQGTSIALDSDRSKVYLTGITHSENFPITSSYDTTYNGFADSFVVSIDIDLTLTDPDTTVDSNVLFGILLLLGIGIVLLFVIFLQRR